MCLPDCWPIMTPTRDKSYEDSLGRSLRDPAEFAAYIDAVIETRDHAALLLALRQAASARGFVDEAACTVPGRKALFTAMAEVDALTVVTLSQVLHALGLRLTVTPSHV